MVAGYQIDERSSGQRSLEGGEHNTLVRRTVALSGLLAVMSFTVIATTSGAFGLLGTKQRSYITATPRERTQSWAEPTSAAKQQAIARLAKLGHPVSHGGLKPYAAITIDSPSAHDAEALLQVLRRKQAPVTLFTHDVLTPTASMAIAALAKDGTRRIGPLKVGYSVDASKPSHNAPGPGSIVRIKASAPNALKTAKSIVGVLRRRGLRLVSVQTLLALNPP